MSRDRLLKQLLRERFIITLKTGETFEGLLEAWDQSTIELVAPHAISETARVEVDGRMYLPREQIAYMQRPGAA